MIKICEQCRTEFWADKSIRRFCSQECMGIARTKKREQLSCKNCGKEFSSLRNPQPKYCSNNCRKEDMHKLRIRVCGMCGEEFEYKHPDNKFCGYKCMGLAKRKERHHATCKQCGNEFESKLPKEKYLETMHKPLPELCSKECRNLYLQNRVNRTCVYCGESFQVPESKLIYTAAKYCSKACQYADMRGPNSSLYIDGRTSEKDKIRHSEEYQQWKVSVFKRDDRKCVWCDSKEKIEADHIRPQSLYPELRYDVDNGRTLCHQCHSKTPSYMNRWLTREDWELTNLTYWSILLSKML